MKIYIFFALLLLNVCWACRSSQEKIATFSYELNAKTKEESFVHGKLQIRFPHIEEGNNADIQTHLNQCLSQEIEVFKMLFENLHKRSLDTASSSEMMVDYETLPLKNQLIGFNFMVYFKRGNTTYNIDRFFYFDTQENQKIEIHTLFGQSQDSLQTLAQFCNRILNTQKVEPKLSSFDCFGLQKDTLCLWVRTDSILPHKIVLPYATLPSLKKEKLKRFFE